MPDASHAAPGRRPDRWIVGAAVLLVFIAAASALNFRNTQRLYRDAQAVATSHETVDALSKLLVHLLEAEVSQRLFLLTGTDAALAGFEPAIESARAAVRQISRNVMEDEGAASELVATLEGAIAALSAHWLDTVTMRRDQGGFLEERIAASSRMMAELHDRIRRIDALETDRLRRRTAGALQAYRTALVAGVMTSLAALVGLAAFVSLRHRNVKSRARAARLLAEREERLRTTLASIADAVISTDARGRVASLNPVAERLTGWHGLDAVGRPLASVLKLVADRAGVDASAALDDACREATTIRMSAAIVAPQPRAPPRPIELSAAPIAGERGGCVVVFRDMSLRREQERSTREARESLRLLMEQAPDAVIVTDRDGRLLFANAETVRLLGYPPDELLGQRVADLIRPEEERRLDRLASSHSESGSDRRHEEWDVRRKDGSWLPVFVSSRLLPDGRWVAFVRDFRDRRQAEEALRFQLAVTKNITDNATTAIFMTDANARCMFMNPAAERMTGHAFADLRGARLHDIVHHHRPDGRTYPVSECPIDRALAEHRALRDHEDVFVRSNGELFPVSVTAQPILQNGAPVGTVVEVRDVTVERRTTQQLRGLTQSLAEADRRKDRFLATLSHELRNPLAPIRNAAAVLATPDLDPARLAWVRDVIGRQVRHLAGLLDDLLDVARVKQGKLALRREPVPLAVVVDTAVEAARPMLDGRGHALAVELPPGETTIDVDALRLSQIVTNLLTNAARYTDPGGRIALGARVDGDALVVAVRDSGIGLPLEGRERLFEMFGQGDTPGRRSEGGLGIGLALTKGLVDLHGGRIQAYSEGPGRGSEFVVTLPRAVVAAGSSAPPAAAAAGPVGAQPRRRVLVADDSADAAETLAMLLELDGHEVRVAHGGRDALAAAQAFRPHAALLDIGMPDLDGCEVARALRREPWGRDMLLVAITGWGQDDDLRRTTEAGFDAHLTKPADPAELGAVLRSVPSAPRTP